MGGSMRIGNGLGCLVVWAAAATLGVAAQPGAERVTSVPLGGSLEGQTGEHYYGVYVPTRFGGELRITTTVGKISELKGPNGVVRSNGQDVGFDQHGWHTFKVEGATRPYTIATTLVQVGESTKRPWNFYYWPTKAYSIN